MALCGFTRFLNGSVTPFMRYQPPANARNASVWCPRFLVRRSAFDEGGSVSPPPVSTPEVFSPEKASKAEQRRTATFPSASHFPPRPPISKCGKRRWPGAHTQALHPSQGGGGPRVFNGTEAFAERTSWSGLTKRGKGEAQTRDGEEKSTRGKARFFAQPTVPLQTLPLIAASITHKIA